ncbi:TniQ family protein [Belnapia rosea]|uniref:TniQ protein n=1 Tax=Belnapia rosea TaxID=938405 RepID=A0A1G7BZP5_9PROT|nr:TniQ family protein [Belnapia rosea]SDE32509.1 TniQ protein [Belnapia rosea]
MTYRLPTAVPPEQGESLPGLIMRNAARYRFQEPGRVLRRLRPPKVILVTLCQTDPAGPLGVVMRDVLGLDEAQWARLAMGTADDTTVRLNGHVVWREQARLDSRTVCPACLADSPHHRAVWFLDALPVCAVHGTRLLSACPDCGRQLKWRGPGVHLCGSRACRYDLRRAEAERVPDGELGGVRAVHRLFHCDAPATGAPLGLGFGDTLRLSVTLGHLAQGMEKVNRLAGFVRKHQAEVHRYVDDGWRALDGWPNGFHRFLDGLKARARERRGKGGLAKAFGTFSSKVSAWSREPWGAPIGEAFAAYAAAQDDLAVNAYVLGRYGSVDALRHRHMSMSEAAKTLGVGPETMQRLAERRNLYILPPNGSGIPSLVKAAEIRRLRDEMADLLLPEEARLTLNVGRKVFEKLEAAGVVSRVAEGERVLEIRPFRRSAVEGLVAACRGTAPKVSDAEARQRGLWTMAATTAPGREPPDVCRALADGRLRAAALVEGQRGLKGIRLDPAEVEQVLPVARVTLSAVEVGEMLGVHYQHVLHWARRGLMGTVPSGGPDEVGMRFSRGTVDAFRAEFILGGELARMDAEGGRANGALTRHLRFMGVPMVSGPGAGDGGKLAVFRRADITPEVLARVEQVRQRRAIPTRELRQRGWERVALAGDTIGRVWGARLRRVNNRFTDEATGRVVQVVSGRRPDLTGVFVFNVQRESLDLLRRAADAWVALVPNQGDTFLLLPLAEVRWRGTGTAHHVTVRFDGRGQPTEMERFAVPLVLPAAEAA